MGSRFFAGGRGGGGSGWAQELNAQLQVFCYWAQRAYRVSHAGRSERAAIRFGSAGRSELFAGVVHTGRSEKNGTGRSD